MNPDRLCTLLRRISGAAAALLVAGLVTLTQAPTASAATPGDAASLAAANVNKTAGTCANTPTTNSLGGSQFENSCTGDAGSPEYWCADFAEWVWQQSGLYTGGLSAAAASFLTYGATNGTLHTSPSYSPQPGDAVVYGSLQDSELHHVGIVTAVNADGSIVTANGDWGGTSGLGESGWAASSHVASITIAADQKAVGSEPGNVDTADGYYIVGYSSPVTSGKTPAPVQATNSYNPNALCGSGFGLVDYHDLGNAVVYLDYSAATGQNCVTTLVDQPGSAVPMNATLSAQGGGSASNPGNFSYYAGPVTLPAAGQCVEWGGTYQSASWTSGWSHCG
ncbi:CHAP domain-containing protein [Kitasatospora sp. NPDC052896]|uniref:CHAP domain-containing protein n=1 Tax=Kitasatospora sp. NPDC052896 TaxID=3364061 RepID=UPI0037CB1AC3